MGSIVSQAQLLPSSIEMARLDATTIKGGVSSLTLMERAGQGVCDELTALVDPSANASLLVLCGCGNNGGDGLVVARLAPTQWKVTVAVAAGSASSEFIHQLQKLQAGKREGLTIRRVGQSKNQEIDSIDEIGENDFFGLHPSPTIILDALLGTGQENSPRGNIATVLDWTIRLRNDWKIGHWISIDVPTGVNATTGECSPVVFHADRTISIELIKRGLTQYPARLHAGELILVPIGIDVHARNTEFYFTKAELLEWPEVSPTIHKGSRGQVLIVAGSRSMPGAAVLCALGALHSGAGTVCKFHSSALNAVAVPPEVMLVHLGMRGGVFTAPRDLSVVTERVCQASAIAIGPGLGTVEQSEILLDKILSIWCELPKDSRAKLVVDADGLTIIDRWLLTNKWQSFGIDPNEIVLTPHPKEAARLLKDSVDTVQRDRFSASKKLQAATGATVLLKGAGTVVCNDSMGMVIGDGGSELAIGGSGDVLTGCIAALLANGFDSFEAAVRGACLHGRAGALASNNGNSNITASEIAKELRYR